MLCRLSPRSSSLTTTRSFLIFSSMSSYSSTSTLASTHGRSPKPRTKSRTLSIDNIRPAVLKVEYAVRGAVPQKATHYEGVLKAGKGDHLPFTKIVNANIGNPQQKGLDQKPITWWRQIAALLEYPDLITNPLAPQLFPPDVLERATELHKEVGSVGAYTGSKGLDNVRQHVADWLEARDGFPADPENIYLTAGASAGVNLIMNVIVRPGDGVLIPIPQYPLYTATLASQEAIPLNYYLNEEENWSYDEKSVLAAIAKAKKDQTPVKALVVINPGNPTGNCLSQDDMRAIIRLCHEHDILLLADEVYQANVFDPINKPFHSFKKVLSSMGAPFHDEVHLVSFHSISKGYSGECGRRGGFFEMVNIVDSVMDQIYKISSVGLCPPLSGQVGVDCLVRPPKEGGESYPRWLEETEGIKNALRDRSLYMQERFNKLEGVSCQEAEGAMYLFPRLHLPKKAILAAEADGKTPDAFYCLALLDATGICLVPGDGFGQKDGEVHFRTTALSPGVEEYVSGIETFHKSFMDQYRD
ncbi:transaminase [Mrakia frigida]|uniref:transaminase n=1 Tax=Mrakia frigida TaxID=29902 RepID=UPI003FCC0EEB